MKQKDTNELKIVDLPLYLNKEQVYSTYPDKRVDIAAIYLKAEFIKNNHLEISGFTLDGNCMKSDEYVKYGGFEGGSVFMLGFPLPDMTVGKY